MSRDVDRPTLAAIAVTLRRHVSRLPGIRF